LIEAINDYPGAAILVSHDRHLLDACADRLWLVAGGKVTPFDGDLEDYRRHVLSDRDDAGGDQRQAKPARSAGDRRASAARRAEAKPLRERVTRAEAEIARLAREIEKLDVTLADGALFARDPAQAAALAKTRAGHAAALAQAEEEWLAAGSELHAATN
jgi:ATP-binding cassette subfamily F protein 3